MATERSGKRKVSLSSEGSNGSSKKKKLNAPTTTALNEEVCEESGVTTRDPVDLDQFDRHFETDLDFSALKEWKALDHGRYVMRPHEEKDSGLCLVRVDPYVEAMESSQKDIITILSNYKDVYWPNSNSIAPESLIEVYSAHCLNHVLKTRARIIENNAKLEANPELQCKDQGLTRPKVLILVPFRSTAFKIVKSLIAHLFTNADRKEFVTNKKKFWDSFGAKKDDDPPASKPEDYRKTFEGNTDDCFRLGIGIAKKSLKLFVDFYSSDLILASPLGLKLLLETDSDFLSSIEVVVLDQAHVFLMQNFQHLLELFQLLNTKPNDGHGVDFSRVRNWSLEEGLPKFYRQTAIFAHFASPELNLLSGARFCYNFEGGVHVDYQPGQGSILDIAGLMYAVQQAFRRFQVVDFAKEPESRLDFFVRKILPEMESNENCNVLIFIPSYFDFVRVRNYLKKNDISFMKISEHTPDNKVTQARGLFFAGRVRILLLSERFHFYRRYKIRGAQRAIFYQPPTNPQFYPEICNWLEGKNAEGTLDKCVNVSVLYSRFDALRLAGVVGVERAQKMVSSEESTHLIVSGK